jgi:predicted metalloprotease
MAEWDKLTSRGNVEDRRGLAATTLGGLGLTSVALYLAANLLLGGEIDLGVVLQQLLQTPTFQQTTSNPAEFEGADQYEVFASTVLGSNNELWQREFAERDMQYVPPILVLFRTATNSGCGTATSQVGPHYCPLDQTIYLDETFFDQLTQLLDAQGGDVAEAYVIAHEVGHHLQEQLGILQAPLNVSPSQANAQSIRVELQADCLAGVWAHSIQEAEILNPGEISEAMDAAASVGDDRIQEKVSGYVNPESWTHGSAAERQEWFTRGYESGELEVCGVL